MRPSAFVRFEPVGLQALRPPGAPDPEKLGQRESSLPGFAPRLIHHGLRDWGLLRLSQGKPVAPGLRINVIWAVGGGSALARLLY